MAGERVGERLRHMAAAIVAIERLTAGRTLRDYASAPDLAAAVERYLERLSEASRHIPQDMRDRHPDIDWRGVSDVGNVLRHAYEQVVDEEIWRIVTDDLPPLKAAVEAMLREVGGGSGE